MVPITPVFSSSLDHSETSELPPTTRNVTNTQFQMHNRDFHAWRTTTELLAMIPALRKRSERIDACCCCPLYVLTTNAKIGLVPGYCRDRLCPTCARRRSRDTFHRLNAEVAKMDSPRFITLTLRHKREPLFLSLARLRACFRDLRKSGLWKACVRGGVYCIEVKRNPQTLLWHAHIHIIADGDFIAQPRLSALWLEITGDSKIVDIRAIHSRRDVSLYVTKYISKPSDLTGWPLHAIREYALDMAGVRAVHAFGSHHGTNTETTDDGCYAGACEPLCSSRRVLSALKAGDKRAADAVCLLSRLGGPLSRALGLPPAPEGEEPDPLTQPEYEELVSHLRYLATTYMELPPDVACTRRALLRIAYDTTCPWSGEPITRNQE